MVPGLTDSLSTSSVADRLPLSTMKISARIRAAVRVSPVCWKTATELVLRLSVSPGTVSRSTSYLQEIDLLHSERDGKRVRYFLGDDLWYRAWLSSAHRNSVWAQTGLDGAEIFGLGTPVGARLKDMGQFFAFVVVDMEATRDKWLDFFEKKKRARGEATEGA